MKLEAKFSKLKYFRTTRHNNDTADIFYSFSRQETRGTDKTRQRILEPSKLSKNGGYENTLVLYIKTLQAASGAFESICIGY